MRIFTIIWIILAAVSVSASEFCVDLFNGRPVPHFPSSVYITVPADVVPRILDFTSVQNLGRAFDQMSFTIGADIPLPTASGERSKKVEVDIDIEDIQLHEGVIRSRLSTKFKETKAPKAGSPAMPKEILDSGVRTNAMVALHLNMINAAMAQSLGNLFVRPLHFSYAGLGFYSTKAPVLKPHPMKTQNSSRVLIQAEAKIVRDEVLFAGLAFKGDIFAKVTLEAEFVIQNNAVSLQVIGVYNDDITLDTGSVRFKPTAWSLNKVAQGIVKLLNHRMHRQPMNFPNLMTVPGQVAGIKTQVVNMTVDDDGYLKVHLNMKPEEVQPTNIKVRIRTRD